jgi:hypothetical protein
LIGVKDERFLYGEDALALNEKSIVRAIKRSITEGNLDSVSIGWGSDSLSLSVDELVTGLLRRIRYEGERNLVSDGVQARFGCPAMWDGARRNRFLALAERAGFDLSDDPLVDEPVAACISWVQDQRAAGNELDGTILVFDMGGGTLDVAVIAVDTFTGYEPKYFVKSSYGIPVAGEKFDEAIVQFFCRQISETQAIPLEDVLQESRWLRDPAREMKEALSSRSSVTQLFTHPTFGPISLALTESELRDLTSELLHQSWVAVEEALRTARLTHFSEGGWGTGVHYSEIYSKPASDLLRGIDYVVLAGGMAKMKAISDMFIEHDVPSHKIHMAGGRSGEPNEAISRGLAEDLSSQRLNLARPAFDLEIEWENFHTGETGNVTIYEAYSPLYAPDSRGMIPSFRWQPNDRDLPSSAHAKLKVVDKRSGEQIDFIDLNDQGLRLELSFAAQSLKHLTLAPNGNLQIIGQGAALHEVRVLSWPLPRENGRRQVQVSKRANYTPTAPLWWEK